jgi:methyl acetate hydrolase
LQVAVLQLVEQGKITFETAVGDIIPEMANPIVLEDTTKELSSYKPAVTKITLKHLLTHTSGLVYQVKPADLKDIPVAYRSKTYGENPSIAQFFKLIQVSSCDGVLST